MFCFVSYKREDLDAATAIVEALRGRGVPVWWDREIEPGDAWEETIERKIREADCMLVLWSSASARSENVKAEARLALGKGKLVQAFLDDCEAPLFFGERQGVRLDVRNAASFRTSILNLESALNQFLEREGRESGWKSWSESENRERQRQLRSVLEMLEHFEVEELCKIHRVATDDDAETMIAHLVGIRPCDPLRVLSPLPKPSVVRIVEGYGWKVDGRSREQMLEAIIDIS